VAAFSNQINTLSSWFALLGGQIEHEFWQPLLGLYQEIFRNFSHAQLGTVFKLKVVPIVLCCILFFVVVEKG